MPVLFVSLSLLFSNIEEWCHIGKDSFLMASSLTAKMMPYIQFYFVLFSLNSQSYNISYRITTPKNAGWINVSPHYSLWFIL